MFKNNVLYCIPLFTKNHPCPSCVVSNLEKTNYFIITVNFYYDMINYDFITKKRYRLFKESDKFFYTNKYVRVGNYLLQIKNIVYNKSTNIVIEFQKILYLNKFTNLKL
jgi:hypothetical protein